MPVEQGLPWHPVATGLAGQAIPCVVAAPHAHATPLPYVLIPHQQSLIRIRISPLPQRAAVCGLWGDNGPRPSSGRRKEPAVLFTKAGPAQACHTTHIQSNRTSSSAVFSADALIILLYSPATTELPTVSCTATNAPLPQVVSGAHDGQQWAGGKGSEQEPVG